MTWWILQIIPPLFVLPLSSIPFDYVSTMFWSAGLIASIASLYTIGRKIFSLFRSKESKSILMDIIRPTLTIIFIIFSIISVNYSLSKAEDFAYETAKNIQKKCDLDNNCPECIPEWNARNPFSCQSLAGGLAKYLISYNVNGDKKEFSIMLRMNIDRRLYFQGGVGKQVNKVDSRDP